MIINNVIIGYDSRGNKLECGDICLFTYKNTDSKDVDSRGLIVYDDSSYSFAFEQIDDNFPMILMDKVDRESIVKICNARQLDKYTKDAQKWIEIYNSNLLVAHLG